MKGNNLSSTGSLNFSLFFWFLLSRKELLMAAFSVKIFEVREPGFCVYPNYEEASMGKGSSHGQAGTQSWAEGGTVHGQSRQPELRPTCM